MVRKIARHTLLYISLIMFLILDFVGSFNNPPYKDIAISDVSNMLGVVLDGNLVDYIHSNEGRISWLGDKYLIVQIRLTPESADELLASDKNIWHDTPYENGLKDKFDYLFGDPNPIDDRMHALIQSIGSYYMYRDDNAISQNEPETYFEKTKVYSINVTVCVLEPNSYMLYYMEWDT